MEQAVKQSVTYNSDGRPRKPYNISEKKKKQLERLKQINAERRAQHLEELVNQRILQRQQEERDRLAKEEIDKKAALDNSKITSAAEPILPSTHINITPPVDAKMEMKEDVSHTESVKPTTSTSPMVREFDIQSMSTNELPRKQNVVWEDMQNVHQDDVDDAATALQMIRGPTPVEVATRERYLPGTGAGNHAPFENEPGYQQTPHEPSTTAYHKRFPPPAPLVRAPRVESRPQNGDVLNEQSIRFLSTLPRQQATRVLAAMMMDDSPPDYDDRFQTPIKRPAPVPVADEFMSHSRVAQSYHPSRLRQSLHAPAQEYGNQFVWM